MQEINSTMEEGSVGNEIAGEEKSPEGQCTCADSEVVDDVCQCCQQLICKYCKTTKHKHHNSQTVTTAAGEIRKNISKYALSQKETEKIDSIQNAKQITIGMKTELIAIETGEVGKIDERMNHLHRQLDEIRTNLVRKVTDVVRQDTESLNRTERILDRTATFITRVCNEANEMMTETNDVDVVRRGYSVCEELNDMFQTEISTPTKGEAFDVQFLAADMARINLVDLVGEVSTQGPSSSEAAAQILDIIESSISAVKQDVNTSISAVKQDVKNLADRISDAEQKQKKLTTAYNAHFKTNDSNISSLCESMNTFQKNIEQRLQEPPYKYSGKKPY